MKVERLKQIAIIQHQQDEDEGIIQQWLVENKIQVTHWKIWQDVFFSPLEAFDGVIVLGGEADVKDRDKLHWMQVEYDWLQRAIELGIPCLGICLGAQILANILGADIHSLSHHETGVNSLHLVEDEMFSQLPFRQLNVHQAHRYRFDIPQNARNLANSELCAQQLFWIAEQRIAGIQCHLEWTADTMQRLFPEIPLKRDNLTFEQEKSRAVLTGLLNRIFADLILQ